MELIESQYNAFKEMNEKVSFLVEDVNYPFIISIRKTGDGIYFMLKFSYFYKREVVEEIVKPIFLAIDLKRNEILEDGYKSINVFADVIYSHYITSECMKIDGWPHMKNLFELRKDWYISKLSWASFGEKYICVRLYIYCDGNISNNPSKLKEVSLLILTTDSLEQVRFKLSEEMIRRKPHYFDYIFGQFFLEATMDKAETLFEDDSITFLEHVKKPELCCQVVYNSTPLM